jgi:hypothetical protein
MRTKLILIVLPLLLGDWFDDPPTSARPDGRPIDPIVFAHDRSVCRYQASAFSGSTRDAAAANSPEGLVRYPLAHLPGNAVGPVIVDCWRRFILRAACDLSCHHDFGFGLRTLFQSRHDCQRYRTAKRFGARQRADHRA